VVPPPLVLGRKGSAATIREEGQLHRGRRREEGATAARKRMSSDRRGQEERGRGTRVGGTSDTTGRRNGKEEGSVERIRDVDFCFILGRAMG
jgi:hypothetical protein